MGDWNRKVGMRGKSNFMIGSRTMGDWNRKVGIVGIKRKLKVYSFLIPRGSNFMISRADKRRSHRKVGFGRTFLHSVFEASCTMGASNRKVGIGLS